MVKPMPQEAEGGSSPCGGEWSEKAPWRWNSRSLGEEWELERRRGGQPRQSREEERI